MNELFARIEQELAWAREAAGIGNEGKARVCARRAVAWMVQAVSERSSFPYGSHVMENLRRISGNEELPPEIRNAAAMLQAGNRAQIAGEEVSADPVADAEKILSYFRGKFFVNE